MSVFTGESSTTGNHQNDNTQEQNTTEDWVAKVVTEKGDKWSDPQAIAKGYVHAQNRIKELEALVGKADQNDYAKELLSKLQTQAPAPRETSEEPNVGGQRQENTTPKPEDIESLIEQTLTKREAANTVRQNLVEADRQLTEEFGTEAGKTVEAKAKELGLDKEALKEIAAKSPSAFMSLMGKAPVKETNQFVQPRVNTSGLQSNSNERNAEYYRKLRRENKTLYMRPETQLAMLEDRARLGAKW